jgi:hypothetical protein
MEKWVLIMKNDHEEIDLYSEKNSVKKKKIPKKILKYLIVALRFYFS